tara:strand:+ start:590 stop:748 length:159 start_codon:yes stop_codon:yes gene_type:complete
LKVELSTDDLYLLQQAIENLTIKGKDALTVSKLLTRISNAFKRQVEKDTKVE